MWGLSLQLKEAQHNAIIAANRIKELEGIIEQGLAYVNHLEVENERLAKALGLVEQYCLTNGPHDVTALVRNLKDGLAKGRSNNNS